MADEVLRKLERDAAEGEHEARLLRARLRRGELELGFAEEAARLGYGPARRLYATPPPVRTPSLETIRRCGPAAWAQLFLLDAQALLPTWELAFPEERALEHGVEAGLAQVVAWLRDPSSLARTRARATQTALFERALALLSRSARLHRCALSAADALSAALCAASEAAALWSELERRDALQRLSGAQRLALVPCVLYPAADWPPPPCELSLAAPPPPRAVAPPDPERVALLRARVRRGQTTRKALRLAASLGDAEAAGASGAALGAPPETAQALVQTLATLRAFSPSAWPQALWGALAEGTERPALRRARESLGALLGALGAPERGDPWGGVAALAERLAPSARVRPAPALPPRARPGDLERRRLGEILGGVRARVSKARLESAAHALAAELGGAAAAHSALARALLPALRGESGPDRDPKRDRAQGPA